MYTADQITVITGGKFMHYTPHSFNTLGYDSRIITNGSLTAFFAIRTSNHDAHRHLQECFDKGVRIFVVEYKEAAGYLSQQAFSESAVILVKNSLHALQTLAAWHRSQFDLPVIAITGSNGKTIVKEWLNDLLKDDFQIVRSPKSFNSQLGVPLSVWQIKQDDTLGIFEAGISTTGEMNALELIIQPQIGIFTTIGDAHSVNFNSIDEKIEEKLLLFKHSNTLIFNADNIRIKEGIKKAVKSGLLQANIQLLGWSYKEQADIVLKKDIQSGFTTLHYQYQDLKGEVKIPFTDEPSIENFSHCITTALLLKADLHHIAENALQLHSIEMRLELKAGINGCTIINDSYNSDLQALSLALDTLNQQKQHSRKTLILSDILQSSLSQDELYHRVAQICHEKGVRRIIGIGEAISNHAGYFEIEKAFFANTPEFLQQFNMDSFSHEAILIKGSRRFGFEKIAERLQQKAHDTVLEINLSALRHNLGMYRSLLKPQVRIMAMVKAFSYGSGSYEIANVLQYHQCDYLAVAYADEGIYLREHGITLPIMVMNPESAAIRSMIEYRLEPEVYSFHLLNEFANVVSEGEILPIHLKLDTGMHRLGFMPADMPELLAQLKAQPQLKIQSVFTHLASTDVPAQDDYTHRQLALFEEMSGEIRAAIGYSPLRHVLNSSGITRFPNAQYDMVRLGIGLYGIDPTNEVQRRLEVVNTLKSRISQIRHIDAGESVGYSRRGVVNQPSSIATIAIGYADGFSRSLGNGVGKVWVNGYLAPVIGSVCMDMTMIDVTTIPAQEGDEVIIFGNEYPVQSVAEAMNTIAYEVLTGIGQRVKRVYVRE
jgi:alanine racemase